MKIVISHSLPSFQIFSKIVGTKESRKIKGINWVCIETRNYLIDWNYLSFPFTFGNWPEIVILSRDGKSWAREWEKNCKTNINEIDYFILVIRDYYKFDSWCRKMLNVQLQFWYFIITIFDESSKCSTKRIHSFNRRWLFIILSHM